MSKKSSATKTISAQRVVPELEKHILVDGFKIVVDLKKSKGSILVDAASGRSFIDCYSFYSSMPVGFNHPYFNQASVKADLLEAAKIKVANADVYSVPYATFVDTFARVMGLPQMPRLFFIEGGAAAVENALKAAMDWKVRKNIAAGRGERGTEILHFVSAFHGRSGYTMSLTNTDPRKTALFAKFPWPRVSSPFIDYSLPEKERLKNVIEKEKKSEAEIRQFIKERGVDIAAIIIEPIQSEGGDNHFRAEWFKTLRSLCDKNDILLIFDEVQTGGGMTGKKWCAQHFGVMPDLMAFGKKIQMCGVMAGPRLDEVEDNVFRYSSRINSTWGGNFCDCVRSTHYMRIIEKEKLVDNARIQGGFFLKELHKLAKKYPFIQAVRGRGLILSFSLATTELRNKFWTGAYEEGLLVLRCGEKSIRLRPTLDVKREVIVKAIKLMDQLCQKMS